MNKETLYQQFLKHRIIFEKMGLIFSGMFLSAIFYFIGSIFLAPSQTTPRELASMELDLRKRIKELNTNYMVKTSLIRNFDSITVRIWDRGIFPIDDWRLSQNGESFIKDFVHVVAEMREPDAIKIDSHYDSISPIKKGDKEFNKAKISNYRAVQVANIFAKKGFDLRKISYSGLSDKDPVVKDRDFFGNYIEKAGSMNRRVDITLKIAGANL